MGALFGALLGPTYRANHIPGLGYASVVPAAEYLLLFRGQDTSGVGQSLALLVVVPPPLTVPA